jgi:glucose-6-phosphate isomerase
MQHVSQLLAHIDLEQAQIVEGAETKRYLSDLRGCFADTAAFEAALAEGDRLIYSVSSVTPADGEGDLHYGLGMVMPGQVGAEYFLTKGHLHEWRPAAEIYIGLRGKGVMVLEHEQGNESQMVPLEANGVVYVPGWTAHRTCNVGSEPLIYLGIYPAHAGHDYASIAESNFRSVVVNEGGSPRLLGRESFLQRLENK